MSGWPTGPGVNTSTLPILDVTPEMPMEMIVVMMRHCFDGVDDVCVHEAWRAPCVVRKGKETGRVVLASKNSDCCPCSSPSPQIFHGRILHTGPPSCCRARCTPKADSDHQTRQYRRTFRGFTHTSPPDRARTTATKTWRISKACTLCIVRLLLHAPFYTSW